MVGQKIHAIWTHQQPLPGSEVDGNFLTSDELTLIVQMDFINRRLSQVRDMFIFSCYTGLSYTDVIKDTPASMVKGLDNKYGFIPLARKLTLA